MKLHVLYDNRALPDYKADWGFACLVTAEETVLFDTGAKPEVLRHNMRAAGIDPACIAHVVLSHDHNDHTGGIECVAAARPDIRVHLLANFGGDVRRRAGSGAELVEVDGPTAIAGGVRTTGPVDGAIPESKPSSSKRRAAAWC